MITVDARPSLRVDAHPEQNYTTTRAISEGTSVDHKGPIFTESSGDFVGGVKMRTDSGFAENENPTDECSPGGSPQDTVITRASRPHQESAQIDSLRKPNKSKARSNRDNRHESAPSTRSSSCEHRKSKTPASSRASSNHRSAARRNSSGKTAAARTTTSRPSSKRSTGSSNRSFTSYGKPPAVPVRSSSSTLPHRHAHNPFALHYKNCHLFQSLGSTLAYQDITTVGSPDPELDEHFLPQPVPRATIIDWTSPSTRRREYAKIDKNSQGLRGWWRRNAPGWCFKDCRAGFYNGEKDSDAGSVRRYRLDLPDEEDDDDDKYLMREKHRGVKGKPRSAGEKRWLGRTWGRLSGKQACK
ncbi:MAG: hypothetical protein M1812_004751 [Candelaria pacifica]|nr:MAG: hypothetical protein M1812_004751 [Candelaria pacifica]